MDYSYMQLKNNHKKTRRDFEMKKLLFLSLLLGVTAFATAGGKSWTSSWNKFDRNVRSGIESFTTTALTDTLRGFFGQNPIVSITPKDTANGDTSSIWVDRYSSTEIVVRRESGLPSGQPYTYRIVSGTQK